LADVPASHVVGYPLGDGVRRGPDERTGSRRVRRSERRLRAPGGTDGVADPLRPGPLPGLRRGWRLRVGRRARAARGCHAHRDDDAEAEGGDAMIDAREIVKRFGDFTALDGVSVEVPAGS